MHTATLNPRGLALDSKELLTEIEHEVVAVIDPERDEDPVTSLDEFGEYDGLSSLTHIDGMTRRRARWN